MKIAVDVDGTLCFTSAREANNWDYSMSIPMERNIARVNRLKEKGHTIIIYTARGTGTGKLKEAYNITKRQLDEWGVKYDEIVVGKLQYDLLIDDLTINPMDWDLVKDIK